MGDGEGGDEVGHCEGARWVVGGGERAEGRAVVEDDGRACGEGRDQPVPHHPGRGGVVEEAGGGVEVAVEEVLFFVLDQRADGAVEDAFRGARCAGGIEDVDRVVGGELGEGEGGGGEGGGEGGVADSGVVVEGDGGGGGGFSGDVFEDDAVF